MKPYSSERRRANPDHSCRFLSWLLLLALLASGCTEKLKTSRHLSRGEKAFAAEQYDRAEVEFLNVLKHSPNNPLALRRLGIIYEAQGRWPQAVVYLRKALETEPNNRESKIKLGQAFLASHHAKEARQQAAAVLAAAPSDEEALLLLADTAATTNEVQATWAQLETLPASIRNKPAWHLARGTLYGRLQNLTQAEAEFRSALQLDPKSSVAQNALATVCLLRNDLKAAEPALVASAEGAPLRSSRRIRLADFQIRTGATEKGKQTVQDLLKKAPDYLPGWLFLAEFAFKQHHYDESAADLQNILARDPINYDALLLNSDLLMAKGQATNAMSQLQRIASTYGELPRVQYKLALAHLLNQDATKAVACLRRALILAPELSEATLLLAQLDLRKGNASSVVDSLTRLLKRQPQVAAAYPLLANAYLQQRSPDKAIALLQTMMNSFTNNPEAPLLLGTILAQERRRAEARKAFEQCLTLAPDFLPALEQVVDLDLADTNYPAAMKRVETQMQKTPNAAELWLLMAKIHLQQSVGLAAREIERSPSAATQKLDMYSSASARPELELAEAALLKAIQLDPNLRMAYLLLAQMYVASHRQQQALERLGGLLTKTNDTVALMLVGMIHDEMKDYSSARTSYEKLLTIRPDFSPALNNLAYLYSARLGDLDRAYELAERARQLQPLDPYTADTLGWILYQKRQYARAVGLLEESALKRGSDPEIQFHVGMAHYMMGEPEPARLALERSQKIEKDFPEREEVPKRLALLAVDANKAEPRARAELERQLKQNPKDPILINKVATFLARDGAFDKAAELCETALALNPDNAEATVRLAEMYAEHLNNRARALSLLKDAHGRFPENPAIGFLLGRLVFAEGVDFKWALSLLEESARRLPEDAEIAYRLAWARFGVGRTADAVVAMEKALAKPEFAQKSDAQRFLAFCHAAESHASAVAMAAEAQHVLVSESNYVPAILVCAVALEERREYREAARVYQRVLSFYPAFMPAVRNLALLYAEQLGDEQQAYPLAVRAREDSPQDGEITRVLGVLSYRRGEFGRCAQLLEECASRKTTDPEILFYLGMSDYQLKRLKDGRQRLQQALALNLRPSFAEEARRTLAQMK